MTEIGDNAFRDWRSLEEMVFPTGSRLEKIGAHALAGTALQWFVAPKNLKTIGAGAFAGCKSLREVKLNEGLEQLGGDGEGVFQDSAIVAAYVPSTLREFRMETFSGCKNLRKVEVAEGCRLGIRQCLPPSVAVVVSAEAPLAGGSPDSIWSQASPGPAV